MHHSLKASNFIFEIPKNGEAEMPVLKDAYDIMGRGVGCGGRISIGNLRGLVCLPSTQYCYA